MLFLFVVSLCWRGKRTPNSPLFATKFNAAGKIKGLREKQSVCSILETVFEIFLVVRSRVIHFYANEHKTAVDIQSVHM